MVPSNSITFQRGKSIAIKFLGMVCFETFLILGLQPLLQSVFGVNQTTVQSYNMELAIKYLAALILFGFLIYAVWRIWKWNKEDKELKRVDFIDTLTELQYKQTELFRNTQSDNNELADNVVTEINKLIRKLERHKSDDILEEIRAKKTLDQNKK